MATSNAIGGLKLLIVDDEPDVLETLAELLACYDIDTARDFDTASDMLSKKRYDMAIFDIIFGKNWKEKDPIFWDKYRRTVEQSRIETEKLF